MITIRIIIIRIIIIIRNIIRITIIRIIIIRIKDYYRKVYKDSLVWLLPTVAQIVPGELVPGAKTFITAITSKRSLKQENKRIRLRRHTEAVYFPVLSLTSPVCLQ